ncbi:hypothetical protein BBK36DRAFT_1168730 [Trichoderma citrinoviride]|uniref:MFS general substrate transporter n=1 Tax=Trichoderma citrinoviride TaxID=58853 RepID=A0A2T4BA44_9HYPO|nr:hypothetical protein BBK36DRAFT_1168730 [Trichoderma citrinoviride]PTB66101.1 hypothetical protein BBK36DRAFT_1168730 [Trichoderma citrinoviride]
MGPIAPNSLSHFREGLESWRWPLVFICLMLTMLIIGYDVSNVANVQTSIYEAFGNVELLPWVAVGYSTLSAATTPLWRKMTLVFPLKVVVFLVAEALMLIGLILAGTASNIDIVIIGRVITGFGSAGGVLSIYVLLLTTPLEYTRYVEVMGAMYINMPLIGVILALAVSSLPNLPSELNTLTWSKFASIDWLGRLLHFSFIVLFSLVVVFSGSTWDWDFFGTIIVWTLAGIVFICSYGIALYYTPLFFAFIRGLSPIDAAVRLLPYNCSFIASTILFAGLLPRIRVFPPFYILSGAMMMAGAGGMSVLKQDTPSSRILDLNILSGISVGLIWQTGNAVMSRLVQDVPRLDKSNLVELFGVSVALSRAGCLFQNVGYSKLYGSISGFGHFSSREIRDALAGIDSSIFRPGQDPRVTIAKIQWVAYAGGAVTFFLGCFMSWEKLDFEVPTLGRRQRESSRLFF